MVGYNRDFVRKARAKQKAAAQKKDPKPVSGEEPVRGPFESPEPGYGPDGKFDPKLYRADMATRWLGGYATKNPNGLMVRRYLKGGDETVGKAALAELLWDGECPPELLQLLAMYLAPTGHAFADRDFVLNRAQRRRGQIANADAIVQVGLTIWESTRAGETTTDAKAFAAATYGLGEEQIDAYWSEFRSRHLSGFEALERARAGGKNYGG